MSAVILPNGSLVFRLPQWTVHIDGTTRQIHLRDGASRDELGGAVFATAPVDTVRRVFLLADTPSQAHLSLEFVTGEGLDLGRVPVGDMGKRIAYAVARVARCGITTSLDPTKPTIRPSDPPRPVAARPYYEQDTGVLASRTNIRREGEGGGGGGDGETVPRIGYREEWRDDFIRQSSAVVAPTTVEAPRALVTQVEVSARGVDAPISAVSVEIVDPSEAATKLPRDDLAQAHAHEEPTVRIDYQTPPRGLRAAS